MGGEPFPGDEDGGDDNEEKRGEKGDGAFNDWEHPVAGVLGREEDKKHRERYPDI